MIAVQPADARRTKDADRFGRFARNCSPAACTVAIVADAPGVRHLADQLRGATLPPELTAALFGFAIGLICGFAIAYPPKDQP